MSGSSRSRLWVALRLVLLVQTRARFLHVYAIVTVLVLAVCRLALPAEILPLLVPVFLFTEPGLLGVNMVAAHRYLEKADGSVTALLVSPLRPAEYLAALVLGSAVVGTAAGAVFQAAVIGVDGRLLWLVPGLFALALLAGCFGFALSLRFADFPRFILGAIPFVALFQLPLLAHFGVLPWQALLWHPATPAMHALAVTSRASAPDFAVLAGSIACAWLFAGAAFALVARLHGQRVRVQAELA